MIFIHPSVWHLLSDPLYYRRYLFTADSTPDSSADTPGARTPVSSAESDMEQLSPVPLPTLPEPSVDRVMGHHVSRPGAALRFPPLRQSTVVSPISRSIRQPIPGTRYVATFYIIRYEES